MSRLSNSLRDFAVSFDKHRIILWALVLRELSTRYGRDNIGFLWVIAEPLTFASGVAVVWHLLRPPYEGNIGTVGFVLTGYLPLLLVRQTISHASNAVRSNQSLLYHRQVTVLHMFLSRIATELMGVSLAAVVVWGIAFALGFLPPLHRFTDVGIILSGWVLVAWEVAGMALVLGALAEMFDSVERVAQIVNYLMIPVTGAFFMVSWLPVNVRSVVLALPYVHGFELIRLGFFGPAVTAYYNIPVAIAWGACTTCLGLALVQYARYRVEIE